MSHLHPVPRRDHRLERGDTLLYESDVRTQVHLDVRSGLFGLPDSGLQEGQLLPHLSKLNRLEVFNCLETIPDLGRRRPVASSRRRRPRCETHRGKLAGLSSESLVIGSEPKVRFIFEFAGLGYSPDHDTWEPRNVLQSDVSEMVAEYKSRHQQLRRRA
ncbi:hypothetical protein PR003_g15759 [Phytophthora rubi]|uniref:Chromo domain-containing protein n=1 Tax=Phytophthora rubi TaxID=129364 RepID=A0A6A3L2X9_9STRA|nr:hypothetical protein PR002_g15626 [Phytophthora rubi]KAE9013976.1 hypothetical protein PR001_g15253 [Phytophthora rubi]KAE9328571.1 hypothetical protein PR003_g15759 [Phytophthora rubi]